MSKYYSIIITRIIRIITLLAFLTAQVAWAGLSDDTFHIRQLQPHKAGAKGAGDVEAEIASALGDGVGNVHPGGIQWPGEGHSAAIGRANDASDVVTRLPYGKKQEELAVPRHNLVSISGFDSSYFVNPNGIQAVEDALDHPIGSAALKKMCEGKQTVAILVDDDTRPTPASFILSVVLKRLKKAGIKKENITIIVAKGTHPELNPEALAEKLGQDVLENYRVIQHNSKDRENLVFVGTTKQGTVVEINKYAADADVCVGIGHISLSPFAGFSGGYKLWLPGISSIQTIKQNHMFAKWPSSDIGILEDNAVRLDMEEAGGFLKNNFLIDVILNSNREIISAIAGDVVQAHRVAVAELRSHITIKSDDMADVCVISAVPYDHSVYHVVHKLLAVRPFVKKGGIIICYGQCPHGIGPQDFIKAMDSETTDEEIERSIGDGELMPDKGYIALRIRQLLRDYKVRIFTRQRLQEGIEAIGIGYTNSVNDDIKCYLQQNGDAKIIVLPSIVVLPEQNLNGIGQATGTAGPIPIGRANAASEEWGQIKCHLGMEQDL
jgi:nickel-dependent lactate racemase